MSHARECQRRHDARCVCYERLKYSGLQLKTMLWTRLLRVASGFRIVAR